MKKIIKNIFFFLIIFIFSLLVSSYIYLNFTLYEIISYLSEIKLSIIENLIISLLILFLLIIILSNSPLPLIAPIQVTLGFLFGFFMGFILALIYTFIACIFGFFISRYLLKDFLKSLLKEKLKKFNLKTQKNAFFYIIGSRIFPLIPYFLINYLSGISNIKFKKYAISTFIGLIPTALIYTFLGSLISKLNSIDNLFGVEIFLLSVFLALISQIPLLIKKT